jgi:hypothetical protein
MKKGEETHVVARPVALSIAVAGGALTALTTVITASAHEHRMVGNGAYLMRVGWNAEPTYTGVRNAVQLFLSDPQGHAVTDLGNSLQVQVLFQGQRTDQLALQPAFGATYGTPGEYDAPLIPTRPGDYTFHFTGTVHGTPVDESFTSSPTTFDSVKDDTSIEFPVRDPSRGELTTRLDRVSAREQALPGSIEAAATSARRAGDSATRATVLGAIGVCLALLLGVAGLLAMRRLTGGGWRAGPPPVR